MEHADAARIQLHRDYEDVCETGLRRCPIDPVVQAAVDRLIAAELIVVKDDYLVVQRPEYGKAGFPEESLPILRGHYERWLHVEQVHTGEQLLYGQIGFWQHCWNLLHEQTEAPVRVDIILPDTPEAARHNWIGDIRLDLIGHVAQTHAMVIRVLLPPCDTDGSLGDLAALLSGVGIEVRVRSSPFLFASYAGKAAVIADSDNAHGEEAYFLTRRPSIVTPLQRLFDDHWSSAIPWNAYERGTSDILELMSLGWTDAHIASALGVSVRTLTRRISDAMTASGVSSRFALGIKYAQSRV